MGLKSFKEMFSSDDSAAASAVDNTGDPSTSGTGNVDAANTSKSGRKLFGKRTSLPPGTGPGTTGHPVAPSEVAMQSDLERSKAGQSTSGYGTDAAAAMGGTLAGTHQGTGIDRTAATNSRTRNMNGDQVTTGGPATYAKTGELGSDTEGAMRGTSRSTGQGLGAVFLGNEHPSGHTEHSLPNSMPTESQEHKSILRPITHRKVRHVENEEISYVNQKERHIHHVQHHTHPIIVREEAQEQLRENIHPTTTHVKEVHSTSNPKDRSIFENQVFKHRDSLLHVPKERTVIDKGTTVKETVHHHIHHVIQPVIEKEIVQKERIRTTVPIHEVVHEAPVIHQMRSHSPVPIQLFMNQFGSLDGVSHDEIIKNILGDGKCVREEGAADSNLGHKNVQTTAHTTTGIGSMGENHGVPSTSGTQRTAPLDQSIVMPSAHTTTGIGSMNENYGAPSKSGTQRTAPLDQSIVMPSPNTTTGIGSMNGVPSSGAQRTAPLDQSITMPATP